MRVTEKVLREAVDHLSDRLIEAGIQREGDRLQLTYVDGGWNLFVIEAGDTGWTHAEFLGSEYIGRNREAFRLVNAISATLYSMTPKRSAELAERRARRDQVGR